MNITIIGCGSVGEKRMRAIGDEHTLLYAVDSNIIKAERLCERRHEGTPARCWGEAVSSKAVDMVIIATPNDALPVIAEAALEQNKHVLVEKPAGRTPEDLKYVADALEKTDALLKVGFNHRFHPALQKAKEMVSSGCLGELMFVRGRYGHGGRKGYEKEWRFDVESSGGGELLDQGVHLIDLSRWMFGCEFEKVSGFTGTYFWDTDLEDNGFMQLLTGASQMAWLHVSATEWKNMFCFEIYGKHGKLQIDGLGGSYGTERLTYYKMLPGMGPPDTVIWEFPAEDASWRLELEYFTDCIEKGQPPEGNIYDAIKAMEIVHSIYGGRAI